MTSYSGPRLRPAPDSPARAKDPGPVVDHYIVHEGLSPFRGFPREADDGEVLDGHPDRSGRRLRSVAGLPKETDDGEVLDGGPAPDRDMAGSLPTAIAVALESERPGVTFGGPIRDTPDEPGDRLQPGELAHDIMGVQVEINLIAAHLPEVAAQVGRLVPGAPVPGGLVRKLGTLRARTATAAAGIGAVVRDLKGPEPARPVMAGVGKGDALEKLIKSLMQELADLLGDRKCEADCDEARRERLRTLGKAIAIVAGAKVGGSA